MRRLPIRWRLTAAFALAMALLLAATGALVYVRLASTLDDAIDTGLRTRADDLTALVTRSGPTLSETSPTEEADESFAQLLAPDGSVIDATPGAGGQQLLSPSEARRAATGSFSVDRTPQPPFDDPARLLAGPVEADGRQLALVVGTSTEERAEALQGLLAQFLIFGPVALGLASLLAYALAAAALRPVDSMRSRAAAIQASEPGQRLPVPDTNDEIARLGGTLNEMLDRLEGALERERRFVADASHELRTPLTLLKGELELARRRPRTREELESSLRSAAEETDRLCRLADDLLVLARADAEGLPLRSEPVRVRDVAERVGARFDRRAAERGRTLDVEAPNGLEVVADRVRLEQALTNLVDNALRHGEGPIRICARGDDGVVELHVLDEGPGFPDGFADRAFDRFSRADDARANGGAGLGLAIARVIAEAHGGTSLARNREDGPGADVGLVLPRR
jgi:two-component system OmpR family sensor kinase